MYHISHLRVAVFYKDGKNLHREKDKKHEGRKKAFIFHIKFHFF